MYYIIDIIIVLLTIYYLVYSITGTSRVDGMFEIISRGHKSSLSVNNSIMIYNKILKLGIYSALFLLYSIDIRI